MGCGVLLIAGVIAILGVVDVVGALVIIGCGLLLIILPIVRETICVVPTATCWLALQFAILALSAATSSSIVGAGIGKPE